jgi:glycosyltransferase involved in cell wall biosynthesis
MQHSTHTPMRSPEPSPLRKILVCITEDWFLLSHFQPLVRTLASLAGEVVVATRSSGRMADVESLGARTVPLDFARASINPLEKLRTVRRIARLIEAERPDVVHVIAMQPMVLSSLALEMARHRPGAVLHLTGLGFLAISQSRAARLMRPVAMKVLARRLGRPDTWLLAENPDDLAYLAAAGADPGERHTILGGAGIDPDAFPALAPPDNAVPVAAFVGRMIRSKGVHVLIEAQRLLAARGVALDVALYGKSDADNPDALEPAELERWSRAGGITWAGHVSDIREVWRRSDIAVLPAITREGLPRAVLEAAASTRPLVVTDVPGCRHFVRAGIEGLLVPPGDAAALAGALARLAGDPALRRQLGLAARARVLGGFTIAQVTTSIRAAYAGLLADRQVA